MTGNSFGSRADLAIGGTSYQIHRLDAVDGAGDLPYSLKILMENLLRTEDGLNVTGEHIGRWRAGIRLPSRTPRSSSALPGC